MHTRIAAIKNMRYGLLLNNTKDSVPSAFDAEATAFPFGGVSGNIKLNNPSAAETAAAMRNVYMLGSIFKNPIIKPAAIHPNVPNTLIQGNCFPGSVIW